MASLLPPSAGVPVRRGPMAHAVSYEVTREVVGQALSALLARMAALEAAQAAPADVNAVRERAATLARQLRALAADDEAGMQALLRDCAAAKAGG